ncbi:MAG: adenylate/guanylate cyclase domain-containing protein [Bacteroidota bacterium]
MTRKIFITKQISLILGFLVLFSLRLPSQTIDALEQGLRAATNDQEKLDLNFKLARNYLMTNLDLAAEYADESVRLARQLNDPIKEAQALLTSADIRVRKGKPQDASSLFEQGFSLASKAQQADIALEAAEKLENLALQQRDYKNAHKWSNERLLRSQERSIQYAEKKAGQVLLEQTAKLESKDTSIRWLAIAMAALFCLLFVLYRRVRRAGRRAAGELAEKNAMIEEKRRRGEQLLLNILPRAVAAELTVRNKVAARRYENATVMFVDFVDFTQKAEQMEPELLVQELDYCFSHFDDIIGRFRIEKIKTVGDAYICASGLSDRNENPYDMVRAALEIRAFLQRFRDDRVAQGRPYFEARIGIHFGPVVAGIVGTKKFAYDIWGDTVNTAARMEEACEPGGINVSGTAYALVKDLFTWQYRGKIAAKHKSEQDMYFVLNQVPFTNQNSNVAGKK